MCNISIFYDDQKPTKVIQSDLFLLCDDGSLVCLCVQDYKSLCARRSLTSNFNTHGNGKGMLKIGLISEAK